MNGFSCFSILIFHILMISNEISSQGKEHPATEATWPGLSPTEFSSIKFGLNLRDEQYTNRMCPEYYGKYHPTDCPDCVREACVVEGDILCKQYKISTCNNDYDDCKSNKYVVDSDERISVNEWSKKANNRVVVSYAFDVLLGSQTIRQISTAILQIEKWLCIDFQYQSIAYIYSMSDAQISELEVSSPVLFFKRSRCLCGITGVGATSGIIFGNGTSFDLLTILIPDIFETKLTPNLMYKAGRPLYLPFSDRPNFNDSFGCQENAANLYHMIFHALGLGHEHNRPDRDNYIFVNKNQILRKSANYLPTTSFYDIDNFKLPYFERYSHLPFGEDSIMLDNPFSWSQTDHTPVLSPLRKSQTPYLWGYKRNYNGISSSDIVKLSLIYGKPDSNNLCLIAPNVTIGRSIVDITQCNDPGIPKGLLRKGSKFYFGAKVFYKCEKSEESILGSELRVCQRDGQWSGFEPMCLNGTQIVFHCSDLSVDPKCKLNGKSFTYDIDSKSNAYSQKRQRREINTDWLNSNEIIFDQTYFTPMYRFNRSDVQLCFEMYYTLGSYDLIEIFIGFNESEKDEPETKLYTEISSNDIYQANHLRFNFSEISSEPFHLQIHGRHQGDDNPQLLIIKAFWLYEGKCKINDASD